MLNRSAVGNQDPMHLAGSSAESVMDRQTWVAQPEVYHKYESSKIF